MTDRIVWLTQDRDDLPCSLSWLAADERARLDHLPVHKRRQDYLLGRWTAKCALATVLDAAPPPAALAIRAAADGAPEAFVHDAPLPLVVSISHAAGRALAVVRTTCAPVGADVERIEPRSQLLVEDFFTADEAARVAACAPAWRDRFITLVWSAKESALKAVRQGLREDTRKVRVTVGHGADGADGGLAPGSWHPLRVAAPGARLPLTGWWRHDGEVVMTVVGHQVVAPPAHARGGAVAGAAGLPGVPVARPASPDAAAAGRM